MGSRRGQAAADTADEAGTGLDIPGWLRRQREARSWSKRELARQLIKAARESGDTAVPGVDSLYHYVNRWENGENGLTERYLLYCCKAFGIPARQFGREILAEPSCHAATVNAHDLSVAVYHAPGRLVIEISGLDTPQERGPGPDPVLALVTPLPRDVTADEHERN
jgi:transcriptional regulator with XRE-family HTH domain